MKYLFIILAIFIISCRQNGTETGNPQLSPIQELEGSKAYQVVQFSCEKIIVCNSVGNLEACLLSQLEQVSYGIKFGLPLENQDWTLSQIIRAEYFAEIISDESIVVACKNQIDSLLCSEPSVQQAYDPNLENPYQNLSDVLQPTCQNMFGP